MSQSTQIVELCKIGPAVVAVVYRNGRRRRGTSLPDGTIAEVPTPDQRCDAPAHPEAVIGIGTDGSPASMHHELLGLVRHHAALSGVFVLPDREVAVVYGARVEPIRPAARTDFETGQRV